MLIFTIEFLFMDIVGSGVEHEISSGPAKGNITKLDY